MEAVSPRIADSASWRIGGKFRESKTRIARMKIHPVIIVGAGPAGVGVAALLSQCAIPALVLERGRVGESFRRWPRETRFISPSFTGKLFRRGRFERRYAQEFSRGRAASGAPLGDVSTFGISTM